MIFDTSCVGNPVEEKHLMMSRGPRSLLDQDLKPNSDEKKQLEAITSYPPIRHLLPDESELLWKFPYYIRSTQKLLTKFLKCVDWSKPSEKKDALRLMYVLPRLFPSFPPCLRILLEGTTNHLPQDRFLDPPGRCHDPSFSTCQGPKTTTAPRLFFSGRRDNGWNDS